MDAPPPGPLAAGQGREGLLAEVARVCDAHVPHGARCLVAVSGGPDSTALAHLLAEARVDLDLTVTHVRHGLRDDAADAATAADHAAALGVPYVERRVDVDPRERGPEAAARAARYLALARTAESLRADVVAVAHTADDQAETVLLNLARGSGLTGLAGMRPARPLHATGDATLVRHLLAAGADASLADRHGNTPLHLSCERADRACVHALTEPVSAKESGEAATRYACQPAPAAGAMLDEWNYQGESQGWDGGLECVGGCLP